MLECLGKQSPNWQGAVAEGCAVAKATLWRMWPREGLGASIQPSSPETRAPSSCMIFAGALNDSACHSFRACAYAAATCSL